MTGLKWILFIPILMSLGAYSQTVSDLRPTVTMKEYVDMQVEMITKTNLLRDEHQKEISRIKDENIKAAYTAQDKRLDGMNEFRDALKDSNKTYVTRSELILAVTTLLGLFWGYSKHLREKQESERKSSGSNIKSGDTVEVKK